MAIECISGTGALIDFVFDFVKGFRRWRIDWIYFRLYQIQHGRLPPSWTRSRWDHPFHRYHHLKIPRR